MNIGTIINAVAIVVATIIGVMFKKGLSESLQKSIMFVLGLAIMILSIGWFLQDFFVITPEGLTTRFDFLIIVSLVLGTIIGEIIDIDGKLNKFAYGIEKKYNLPPLAKGFISGTLIFCVGAMAILGALQDGLYGNINILVLKSALDFVTAMILASVMGFGVAFSAISVLIYQGFITLLAKSLTDFLTLDMMASISMVGNMLLVVIGLNFMEIKKIRVANMLPSLIIPVIYFIIISFL